MYIYSEFGVFVAGILVGKRLGYMEQIGWFRRE
jgi:hypothetical protein